MSACDDRDPEACWDCGVKDGLMPCRYCWNCQREEFEWRVKDARAKALAEARDVCQALLDRMVLGKAGPIYPIKVVEMCIDGIDALPRPSDCPETAKDSK